MAILLIGPTVISVALALLAAYSHQHNFLNKLGLRFGLSKRFGDEDVWETFLEQLNPPCPIVRDGRTNRTYYGILTNYSETNEHREIALEDVQVFDDDGTFLYKISRIYLSREREDLTLEYQSPPRSAIIGNGGSGRDEDNVIGDEHD